MATVAVLSARRQALRLALDLPLDPSDGHCQNNYDGGKEEGGNKGERKSRKEEQKKRREE